MPLIAVGRNLMVDTLIANASPDERVSLYAPHCPAQTDCLYLSFNSLRTIVRSMLATSPPNVAANFVSAARGCLSQSLQRSMAKQPVLFEIRDLHSKDSRGQVMPTAKLSNLLSYARTLYGAGMGFDSLDLLSNITRTTAGLRWRADDNLLVETLAIIDTDISQAIQSCREELLNGNVRDITAARNALRKLRRALADCRKDVEGWGGEFPFSRGSANADCLQF